MKLAVRDFLKTSRWSELDTETGELKTIDAPADGKAKGYVTNLGKQPAAFYAEAGALMLRVGEDRCKLEGVKVDFSGEGLRTLKVLKNQDVLLRVAYPNPVNPPMEFDTTVAEEEDFDLGLFIKNVTSNPKRRSFMLSKWS